MPFTLTSILVVLFAIIVSISTASHWLDSGDSHQPVSTMSSSAASTSNFNAVVFGGTGAVGRVMTHQLVYSPHTEHVLAVVRRKIDDTEGMWGIDKNNDKLNQLVVDYEQSLPDPSTSLQGIQYHAAFSSLGTTRKTAGSAEAFRKIDHGYVIKSAEWSKQANIQQFLYCSAQGANKDGFLLYPMVKGQIEHDLHQRPESTLPIVTVGQPGFLAGQRIEHRMLESVALSICKVILPSVVIDVRAVANAFIQQAWKNMQTPSSAASYTVLSHKQMKNVGVPTEPQLAWEPQPAKK